MYLSKYKRIRIGRKAILIELGFSTNQFMFGFYYGICLDIKFGFFALHFLTYKFTSKELAKSFVDMSDRSHLVKNNEIEETKWRHYKFRKLKDGNPRNM